jgi:aconitate hydratase
MRPSEGDGGHLVVDLRKAAGTPGLRRVSYCRRILLENLLRRGTVETPQGDAIGALLGRNDAAEAPIELTFRPARVVMQDYAGLSALVDLAALRDLHAVHGRPPESINPTLPVELVIDHSHVARFAGSADALERNLAHEFEQNRERFAFLAWARDSFSNLRVVPPGNGILHQIHLESIAEVMLEREGWLLPDSVIGTDSHTPMINGLGVLGWGVGGIEAEAVMLGRPVSLLAPKVTGVRLTGALRPGILATDAVLEITERLRGHGVTGSFVEFHGPGLAALPVPDRATIANMAPEYGATCGYFPIDDRTLDYLSMTGRDERHVARVGTLAHYFGLWHDPAEVPDYRDLVEIDLSRIERCLAGPKLPQQRRTLGDLGDFPPSRGKPGLDHGDIVIAAITSCTNTANPAAMITAGLLAREARRRGLHPPAHVRCSFAPGSGAVADYLGELGLLADLQALGFWIVGIGCSTCVGNSGDLAPEIAESIAAFKLTTAAILSGNRNFEGRIHPLVQANYLASPPLVVALALAGHLRGDLLERPITDTTEGPVRLADLWPSQSEVDAHLRRIRPTAFRDAGESLYQGGPAWAALAPAQSVQYPWDPASTYLRAPDIAPVKPAAGRAVLASAAPLLVLGDSITTDHISPVGRIDPESDAGRYLGDSGVSHEDFNTFGARRGNAAVMLRGTFAHGRLRNRLCPGHDGPVTLHGPSGDVLSVFEAAARYRAEGLETIIIAGRNYGTGSARDWAAKGTRGLGICAVIAESFERIHRSNLVLMGVLPLEFQDAWRAEALDADARTRFTISEPAAALRPSCRLQLRVDYADGRMVSVPLRCRLDTAFEVDCFQSGGIFGAFADS